MSEMEQLREALRKLHDCCIGHMDQWPPQFCHALLEASRALQRSDKPKPEEPKTHPAVEAFAQGFAEDNPWLWTERKHFLEGAKWALNYAADTQCEPAPPYVRLIACTDMRDRLRKLAEGLQ